MSHGHEGSVTAWVSAKNHRVLITGLMTGTIYLVDVGKEAQVQSWFVFSREDASMFAVIKSGGKQYRVTPGQTIRLEKVAGEVGSKVTLSEVLLVDNDGNISVGAPLVANASIEATVVEHDRSKKILVFKKKRKKQYRRTRGHRQDFTAVRIDKITV
jgi:large subunit ribosomal protein L21